ncbi:glycerophosphodiester phosphodiesterase family protein [Pseudooceanicola sp. 502str34]
MPATRTALPEAFLTTPIAHRAYHDRAQGRPENGRAAIRAAIAAGYGIEIDLQPSADGKAMVFHDYDLARLTGAEGMIRMRKAADLAELPLIGGDEGIPSFAEVLEIVAGQVPLLVEIKDQDGLLGPGVGALEAAAVADLKGYKGPVALMSFNPNSVRTCAGLAPEIPRGLTTCSFRPADWRGVPKQRLDRLARIPDADPVGASFLSHEHRDLDRPRVQELKDRGLAILCWTIRSAEEEDRARRIAQNVTFEDYAA